MMRVGLARDDEGISIHTGRNGSFEVTL